MSCADTSFGSHLSLISPCRTYTDTRQSTYWTRWSLDKQLTGIAGQLTGIASQLTGLDNQLYWTCWATYWTQQSTLLDSKYQLTGKAKLPQLPQYILQR